MPPHTLLVDFTETLGLSEAPLTSATMVASSFLPGSYRRDPRDRILIAMARETGARILTRNRAILAYGAAGHVRTLAC
jgi:PIN domain nuclease of toxin-antitoxin system